MLGIGVGKPNKTYCPAWRSFQNRRLIPAQSDTCLCRNMHRIPHETHDRTCPGQRGTQGSWRRGLSWLCTRERGLQSACPWQKAAASARCGKFYDWLPGILAWGVVRLQAVVLRLWKSFCNQGVDFILVLIRSHPKSEGQYIFVTVTNRSCKSEF